ncbi:hypothetical protein [Burkholderia cenocepacia]|uniref:hypothetical protein n=1 Tax=Burkholderia cenocepacia TaxID=95486 RepID=UPI000F5B7FE3|nr:hypothetical protein [Burkholderia cenocepacia]
MPYAEPLHKTLAATRTSGSSGQSNEEEIPSAGRFVNNSFFRLKVDKDVRTMSGAIPQDIWFIWIGPKDIPELGVDNVRIAKRLNSDYRIHIVVDSNAPDSTGSIGRTEDLFRGDGVDVLDIAKSSIYRQFQSDPTTRS